MRADMVQVARWWLPIVVVVVGLLAQLIAPAGALNDMGATALTPARVARADVTNQTDRLTQPRAGYWRFRETRTVTEACADQPPRPDECHFSSADGKIEGYVIHTPADGPKWTWGGGMTWTWAPTGSMELLSPGDPLGLGAETHHVEKSGAVGGYFRWGHLETNGDVHEGDSFLALSSPAALGYEPSGSVNTVVPAGPWGASQAEPLVLVAAVYHIGRVHRIYDWVDATAACRNWAGQWVTDFGELVLTQAGDSVSGVYDYRNGRLQGTISEEMGTIVLRGTWTQDNGSGEFEFTMTPDCRGFNGRWRNDSSGEWHTDWSGTRVGSAPPAGATPVPPPPPPPGATPTVAPTPTTGPAAATFTGPIRFGTSIAGEQLVGESTAFPAGTARIYAYFQRQHAPGGTPYTVRWSRDGQVTNRYDYTTPVGSNSDGATWIWLGPAGGFSPGQWEVVLTLNGADVLRGGFTVR